MFILIYVSWIAIRSCEFVKLLFWLNWFVKLLHWF